MSVDRWTPQDPVRVAAARVTLPWAQRIWDSTTDSQWRDTAMRAFAPPFIDPADRTPQDPKHVVSLAVVLDLLATRLRTVASDPQILAHMTEHALAVSALGGSAPDAVCARLFALAQSDTAAARAAFVEAFAREIDAVLAHPADGTPTPATTTPDTVAQAMARVTQAATLVIREAELLLAQRRARTDRQI